MQSDDVSRLNAYLELEMKKGPVLLPKFWWLSFAFAVPFVLAAASTALIAISQHACNPGWASVRCGSLAGMAGLLLATYFYMSLVNRLRH